MGGEIMFVEAARMGGEGKLTLTGQLGTLNASGVGWARMNLYLLERNSSTAVLSCGGVVFPYFPTVCFSMYVANPLQWVSRRQHHVYAMHKYRLKRTLQSVICYHNWTNQRISSVTRGCYEGVCTAGAELAKESLCWGTQVILVLNTY